MYVCIYVSLCMYDLCICSQSIWHCINGGDINRLRKRPGQSLVLRAWNLGSQSICDAPADETNDELLSRGADFPNWAVRAGNLEGDAWHFLQVGLRWWHFGIASALSVQAAPIWKNLEPGKMDWKDKFWMVLDWKGHVWVPSSISGVWVSGFHPKLQGGTHS